MKRLIKMQVLEGVEFTNTPENKAEIELFVGEEIEILPTSTNDLFVVAWDKRVRYLPTRVGDYLVRNPTQNPSYFFVLNKDEVKYYQVQEVVELKIEDKMDQLSEDYPLFTPRECGEFIVDEKADLQKVENIRKELAKGGYETDWGLMQRLVNDLFPEIKFISSEG